jgi:plasmid stability protein
LEDGCKQALFTRAATHRHCCDGFREANLSLSFP